MDAFWQEIYQSLNKENEVVVAVIVNAGGSIPRSAGTKMLIHRDGRITGTIGGGTIEADVIRRAGSLFTSGSSSLQSYNLNIDPGMDGMDLICGGRMEVLIEYIAGDDHTLELYRCLSEAEAGGECGFLIGRLIENDGGELTVERSLILEDALLIGPFPESSELQEILSEKGTEQSVTALLELEGRRFLVDAVKPAKTVYLIGGGHISKEVAPLAHKASFRTVVIDDRPEFADPLRFPDADVFVCPDTGFPLEGFKIDENSYLIIITRGHGFDREALAQALETPAAYIGMIGSRKKRNQIYTALREEGVTEDELQRVHCPIGLPIGAETPFEIAVSIVAEIIRHRAQKSP